MARSAIQIRVIALAKDQKYALNCTSFKPNRGIALAREQTLTAATVPPFRGEE